MICTGFNNLISSFLGAVIPAREDAFTVAPRSKRVKTRFFDTAITDPELPLSPNDFYDKVRCLVLEHCLYDTTKYERLAQSLVVPFGSFEQAAVAARKALTALGDKHTELLDASETARLEGLLNDPKQIVSARIEDQGAIGYLGIKTFMSWHVAAQARAGLERLTGANAIILDLRFNGGGILTEALNVFDLLVDRGELININGTSQQRFWLTDSEVHTLELDGSVTTSPRAGNLTGAKPLIVLINEETASAAEALARALEKYRGARIVGMPTKGKNTAQRYWLLDGGTCLKMTFAKSGRQEDEPDDSPRVLCPRYQFPRLALWEDAQYFVARDILTGVLAVDRLASGNASLKNGVAAIQHLHCLLVRDICAGEQSMKDAPARFGDAVLNIEEECGIKVELAGELFKSGFKVMLWVRELEQGLTIAIAPPFRPRPVNPYPSL